ncbi:hypothetical protein JTB14_016192 [Gonioctena quinquepunctata]|nr:hypothetical protein JTB14_016192 [Gonioctena quinquepunctata]
MEWLSSLLPQDTDAPYYFLVVAVLVLGALYLHDMCNRDHTVPNNLNFYGYGERNGPCIWKRRFPAAEGLLQSPINLKIAKATVVPRANESRLVFSADFHAVPSDMKIHNNSHNVVVYASWGRTLTPSLTGGPLTEHYNFHNLRFRWGANDHEGSEHMVNSTKFAMELQAAFVKSSADNGDVLTAASTGALLMLSYVFSTAPLDNPYLEPIINSLKFLRFPMSCICIEPVVLSSLMPGFSWNYYSYTGSLTFPPCIEGVLWIVNPEPMLISSRQVKQFRKLNGCRGRIETNTRPVQCVGNRDVFFYD